MTDTTVTLRNTGCRPLTVNRVAKMHRQQWAAHTAAIRGIWHALARGSKTRRFDQVHITATPLHANGRSPQDAGGCAPEVKAAIDGLVDAGVLPDDDGTHLVALTFMPPRVCGVDGLELHIEEASEVTS